MLASSRLMQRWPRLRIQQDLVITSLAATTRLSIAIVVVLARRFDRHVSLAITVGLFATSVSAWGTPTWPFVRFYAPISYDDVSARGVTRQAGLLGVFAVQKAAAGAERADFDQVGTTWKHNPSSPHVLHALHVYVRIPTQCLCGHKRGKSAPDRVSNGKTSASVSSPNCA